VFKSVFPSIHGDNPAFADDSTATGRFLQLAIRKPPFDDTAIRHTTGPCNSSHALATQQLATAVRRHWGVENQIKWILDTSFTEGARRIGTA
jgi:hypothetical protein